MNQRKCVCFASVISEGGFFTREHHTQNDRTWELQAPETLGVLCVVLMELPAFHSK